MRAPKLFDRRQSKRAQADRRTHHDRVPDDFCSALAEALLVQLRDSPQDPSRPFRLEPLWKSLQSELTVREIDAIAASGALLGEGLAEQSGQGMYEMSLTAQGRRALEQASQRPLQRLLSRRRSATA
ncbi:MAG: hypothetical protein ABF271_00040 [Abyssibacter sp.]|uniref:hypothetical protein n=1 Tax=Abyssibacter sp. TaxID=2320200 RepID=UPI00321964BC